jgi:uncharacterized membrane protein YhaH (DUF805 family)
MHYFIEALREYATFDGRSGRKAFWMFILFNILISAAVGIVERMVGFRQGLSNLYSLVILVPSLAVSVRRMHDVGKSGWYILVPLYNLVLYCRKGDAGINQYGAPSDATPVSQPTQPPQPTV